jgi:hypothetical protein
MARRLIAAGHINRLTTVCSEPFAVRTWLVQAGKAGSDLTFYIQLFGIVGVTDAPQKK